MIDFELYRIFVEVAKERNITKASEKLNVSQPAITKQIKNLEEQLSMKLLERKSKGVELTLEGKKLYEKISEYAGTRSTSSNVSPSGHVCTALA